MIDYGASGFVELFPSSLNFKVSKLEISYTSIVVDTFAMAEAVQFWWTRFPQLTAVYVSPLQDEYQMMWNETYEIYETYETCPFVFVVMARTRSDKYISIKDTAPDGTAQARWVHLLCFRGTVALRPGGCGGHAQQQCGEQASYESGGLGFVYPLGAMQIVGKVEYHLF